MSWRNDLREFTQYRTFVAVWLGQLVSGVGSTLAQFALAFWVYEETGSTTQLAMVILLARLPEILITPFSGAIVDRWPRRRVMILSDAGASLGTLAIMVLLMTDSLEIWHLYIALGLSGTFGSLQFPAYTAATTLLVPKRHHGRAAGLVQLAGSAGIILGPILGAVILTVGGLATVFAIDFATFLVAVAVLALVRFPEPKPEPTLGRGAGALLREAKVGLDYVRERPGLFGLMLTFSFVNFAILFHSVLIYPLLLSFVDETGAGAVISTGAIGMLLGGMVMSLWGGPAKPIPGLMAALGGMGVGLLIAGLRPSTLVVALGLFVLLFSLPIAAGISQAFWQSKVRPELQGRVFSLRLLLALGATPLSYVLAGPIADGIFQPLLDEGGVLNGTVGALIGTGPGRGAGAFFVVLGLSIIALVTYAAGHPRIRNLDASVPDVIEDVKEPVAA
ncbi:MAG: MFS transporter [Acidimicrobiia bacterium]|nr:MFS transporter [Acidimicrobiia bacterium]